MFLIFIAINDVGDAPYNLIRPILRKVQAEQLLQIERNSPHIEQKSQEVWEYFIRRDFQEKGFKKIESALLKKKKGDQEGSRNKVKQQVGEHSELKQTTCQEQEESSGEDPEEEEEEEAYNESQLDDVLDYRKLYWKLATDQKAHLEKASNRLRANIEQINKDRDYWKITQLSVDPKSVRSNAFRKRLPGAPFGSKMLQKTIQNSVGAPSIFSPRNVRFVSKTSQLSVSNRIVRPPRSSIPLTNSIAGLKRKVSLPPLSTTQQPVAKKQQLLHHRTPPKVSTSHKLFNLKPSPSSPPSNPAAFPASSDVRYRLTPMKVTVPLDAPVSSTTAISNRSGGGSATEIATPSSTLSTCNSDASSLTRPPGSNIRVPDSVSHPSTGSATNTQSNIRKRPPVKRKPPSIFINKR